MSLIVQKFGGTSVGSVDRIKRVAQRISAARAEGHGVVVIVSAMGHTTDELLELLGQVSVKAPPREVDMLLTTGEQVSVALVATALEELGCPARSILGFQAGIETEPNHTRAAITQIRPTRLEQLVGQGVVPVVAGFQGITPEGEITTLGRGGSDTTAVALAAALEADMCEIYTDVDGVYTTDPRIVPEARLLREISYEEMLELASLGAKVLHPRSVEYAKRASIFLKVRSSFSEHPGTVVKGVEQLEIRNPVNGVTADLNQAKVALLEVPDKPGVAAEIFGRLAEKGINVDVISQSVHGGTIQDVAFTIALDDLAAARELAEAVSSEIGAKGVVTDDKVAKVSIVGAGMINHPGTAAQMFGALAQAGINIQMISTSEIKVSCVIERSRALEAIQIVHRKFALHEEASQPVVLGSR
ncbi:MAG: aspartate kinase [Candidatus Sericytochromatia bacterium]|nr:aspartate kinase [Candidatus Tanganyikabacteria bacterium]